MKSLFEKLHKKTMGAAAKIALRASGIKGFLTGEEGSLDQMVWVIGAAVVVVLIVVAFMVLAPSTAKSMWNSFTNYARSQFGF